MCWPRLGSRACQSSWPTWRPSSCYQKVRAETAETDDATLLTAPDRLMSSSHCWFIHHHTSHAAFQPSTWKLWQKTRDDSLFKQTQKSVCLVTGLALDMRVWESRFVEKNIKKRPPCHTPDPIQKLASGSLTTAAFLLLAIQFWTFLYISSLCRFAFDQTWTKRVLRFHGRVRAKPGRPRGWKFPDEVEGSPNISSDLLPRNW